MPRKQKDDKIPQKPKKRRVRDPLVEIKKARTRGNGKRRGG